MWGRPKLLGAACLACVAWACGGAPQPAVEPVARTSRVTDSLVASHLDGILRANPRLRPFVERAETYRLQVLVSVVGPDGSSWRTREGFRADAEYFYPASAIKLCIATAALAVVTDWHERDAPDVDVDTRVLVDAAASRHHGAASVANLLAGSLVFSDNDASNTLFDLVGFDNIHERMWGYGLSSFRLWHRLGVADDDDARVSLRLDLLTPAGVFAIRPREAHLALEKNEQDGVLVGDSHIARGKLVDGPMSFETKNRVSLSDLQDLLIAVVKPELASGPSLDLGASERALLVDTLSATPSSRGAKPSQDYSHKPLLAGIERVIPRESLTLASKSGRAYGFVVENAYVADARSGRAFFVAAVLYVNPNGRVNDDTYPYEESALPALSEIGEVVTRYALEL